MKSNNQTKKVIYPRVVAGGTAVPLGKNFYYMTGKKHKDGGIDIGKNPNTGLEVEDGEVMHLTNKEVKVFSSVPFLDGKSPAQKVLQGDAPNKVFNAQESFKDRNNINDDGTKKQNGGKVMNRNKYVSGGGKKKNKDNILPNTDTILNPGDDINSISSYEQDAIDNESTWLQRTGLNIKNTVQKGAQSVKTYYKENPGALNDTIGIGANIIGGLIANRTNNKMLDKLQYAKAPYARQATKLKTSININPQLDKMRETVASYERDIDSNTASSRVALARKQRGRVAGMLQTNELYGHKENLETELINKDKLNQQQVADANLTDHNQWAQGKAAFDNAVVEKRSENKVSLIDNINSGIQDVLTRVEKRKANKDNMLAMSAGNPNVNPRILKELGVSSITDKMVEDWEKAHTKKSNKPKGK